MNFISNVKIMNPIPDYRDADSLTSRGRELPENTFVCLSSSTSANVVRSGRVFRRPAEDEEWVYLGKTNFCKSICCRLFYKQLQNFVKSTTNSPTTDVCVNAGTTQTHSWRSSSIIIISDVCVVL